MKKYILLPLILSAVFLVSCEDNLSPKTEFKEEYAMYGVINVDTTFQTIYLSHSYQVDGFNGMDNKIDPALTGANVKIDIMKIREINRVKDTTVAATYFLHESSSARNDISRYNTPVKYYSYDNYKPVDGDIVQITALLANGKTLSSKLLIPPITYLFFETSTLFYDPTGNGEGAAKEIKFSWRFLSSQFNTQTNYFAPRLEITYHKADNPENKIKIKVPYYFVPKGDSYVPLYPNVSTSTTAHFYNDSIERVLRLISDGDANKSNYIIDGAEFILLLLDKNLASYLAAENTYSDEFSIRIDASDFSNINGGLGMFGAAASKKTKVKISKAYIQTFGYGTSY